MNWSGLQSSQGYDNNAFKEYYSTQWNSFTASPLMFCAMLLSAALIIFNTGLLGTLAAVFFTIGLLLLFINGCMNKRNSSLAGMNFILVGMFLGLGVGAIISIAMFRTVLRIKNDVESKDPYKESMGKPAILLFIAGVCVVGFVLYMYSMKLIEANMLLPYILLFALHMACAGLLLSYGNMKSNIYEYYLTCQAREKKAQEAQKTQTSNRPENQLDPNFDSLPAWKKVELMKQMEMQKEAKPEETVE